MQRSWNDARRSRGLKGVRVVVVSFLISTAAAVAQHTDDNAITAASDAFGLTVGAQSIGLYSQNDARGFDPQQAGNLRIEGLYYDQQMQYSNPCLFRETVVHVGMSAQTYSFPSPSGIVELKLPPAPATDLISGTVIAGPMTSRGAELDWQYMSEFPDVSMSACVALNDNADVNYSRRSTGISIGDVIRFPLAAETRLTALLGYGAGHDHDVLPEVFTDGSQPPPVFQERALSSQAWAGANWQYQTGGVIFNETVAGAWRIAAGLFRSIDDEMPYDQDLYLITLPNRVVEYELDAVPAQRSSSTSGEVHVSRLFSWRSVFAKLEVITRGRSVGRAFGGDAIVGFGEHLIDDLVSIPLPSLDYTATSRDTVRQLEFGGSFSARRPGVGWINLGLQRVSYHRQLSIPGLMSMSDAVNPWLPTLSIGAEVSRFKLYSSFTEGLEDSAIAPPNATNRGTPPAATRTAQIDGGVRLELDSHQQLLVGGFEVRKNYFAIDATSIYRNLGSIRHNGIEVSFTQRTNWGASLVIGGVYVRPHVTVIQSLSSPPINSPLGTVPVTLNASIDYAPSVWHSWSSSLRWNFISRRPAIIDGSDQLPALSTVGVGIRYKAQINTRPITISLDGLNLTDAHGMHTSSVGYVLPELGRRAILSVTTDL